MFLVPVTSALSRQNRDALSSFDRFFEDAFDRFFGQSSTASSELRTPAIDVAENEKQYTVQLEVPGVNKEDVKVSIDGRRVTVSAQTSKTEERKEGDRVIYRERSASSFARSFTLPVEVDQSESSAKLENGVLALTLAKKRANAAAQIAVS